MTYDTPAEFARHRTVGIVLAWNPDDPKHCDAYDELMNAAGNAMVVPGIRLTVVGSESENADE